MFRLFFTRWLNPLFLARSLARIFEGSKRRIYLVNEFYEIRSCVDKVLEGVKRDLDHKGIKVCPVKLSKIKSFPFWRRDIVVAHQPIVKQIYVRRAKCFGMPSMDRRERLEFLQRVGFPTMPWSHPEDRTALESLFDRWNASIILVKRDTSLKALGVQLLTREQVSSIEWTRSDVFCPVLTEDPITYKLHFFGGEVLCAYAMATPPIIERRRQNLLGPQADEDFGKFEPPHDLIEEVRKLGLALLEIGGGYSSIDLMKQGGRYVAIELNTNSIGTTRPWPLHEQSVKQGLCSALIHLENRKMYYAGASDTDREKAVRYFSRKMPEAPFAERFATFQKDLLKTMEKIAFRSFARVSQ